MPPSGPQGTAFTDGAFIEHLASPSRLDETGLSMCGRTVRTSGRTKLGEGGTGRAKPGRSRAEAARRDGFWDIKG